MTEPTNQFAPSHVPLLRRLGWRLLPPTRPTLGLSESRDWCSDVIHVNIDIHLGLVDRLRCLLFGRLEARARVYTEHQPGRTEAESEVSTA